MFRSIASVKLVRVLSLFLLVSCLGLPAYSQRGRDYYDRSSDRDRYHGHWDHLGSANVDGARDHDRIVPSAGGAFRALQLGVKDGDIEFYHVVVHFENGENQELQVRDRIRAGGRSRVLDLAGDRRRIRSVEFWYGKADWRERRPRVNLWGLR